MKAMILAAGLGTRLKPITDKIPKALVEVDGKPMLERIILTLKNQGFDYIVVNVHHFADQIIDFLNERNYGIKIYISNEKDELLDTGGGIVKAKDLIFKDDDQPVLIHNVDIISNANLQELMDKGRKTTTLLVSDRSSKRKLIFDSEMELKGWHDIKNDKFLPPNLEDAYRVKETIFKELAFSGIYVITLSSVNEMEKLHGRAKFSVMEYFLNPERRVLIKGYENLKLKLLDMGKPETLQRAEDFLT